jgi:hypothetical protein
MAGTALIEEEVARGAPALLPVLPVRERTTGRPDAAPPPGGAAASRLRRATQVPHALRLLTFVAWLVAVIWVAHAGLLRAYGDALAHELIARRVTDSIHPGIAQLGTVWLPLPPLLLASIVWSTALWHSGLAGALLGAFYLQAATGALYRMGLLLGGAAMGWAAALAFLVNPNTLYLFVTPLTEAPALAFTCLCAAAAAVVLDGLSRGEIRTGSIFVAAFFAACGMLSRYDGWMLAALVGGALLIATAWHLRDRYAAQAVVIAYLLIPCCAIVLWLLYNLLIFGDALTFLRGEYSSAGIVADLAARGVIPAINGLPPEAHHPLRALGTYLTAVVENAGLAPAALAVSGCALVCARMRRATGLIYVVLLAPLLFYVVALTTSQSVIITRAVQPNGLFNVRYGATIAPLIALALAAIVPSFGRHARIGAAAIVAIALASGIGQLFEPLGPVVVAEGRLQDNAITATASHAAARWFAAQPHDGLTLMDDALQPESKILYVEGGRTIREYVDSSDPTQWRVARVAPPPEITSVIVLSPGSRDYPSDRVSKALVQDGRIAGFRRVFDNGEIVIFHRAPDDAMGRGPR